MNSNESVQDRSLDQEMNKKAKSLLEAILESTTTALSHVNLFGFTCMHMAPSPTVGEMLVVMKLLKVNIEFILKADEISLNTQTKNDLENSLIQINLMTMLAAAIKNDDQNKFNEAVAQLERTIPA